MNYKIFFLISIVVSKCLWADIRWNGVFKDPTYQSYSAIRLEVLESGDTAIVEFEQNFSILLPPDTLWNVCFTAKEDERCYELVYDGGDSVFFAAITGKDLRITQISTPEKVVNVMEAAEPEDSLFIDNNNESGYYGAEDKVTLKKVLLRVRRIPKRALGKSTVSAKMIKRMPGLAEADVIRSIQGLPGVVASSDFSTKIYVRGGGADQNLFLLDNGVVYSPVHFFGLFSTFLVDCLDEVDFYKGGFSPQYGNRLSSVLDIKSRRGETYNDTLPFKLSVQISTFAATAHTEGRVGDVSWNLAGRGTYIKTMIDLLRKLDLTDLNINYRFYDMQGYVNYNLGKDRSLSFSLYQGDDVLDFTPFTVDWGNKLYPLNLRWRFSDDWDSKATLSYGEFEQSFGLQSIFRFENSIENLNFKYHLMYEGLDDHRLAAGVDVKKLKTVFINDQEIVGDAFEDNADFWLLALYLEDVYSYKKFEFKLGARLNYSELLDDVSVEPRFSIQYQLNKYRFIDWHVGYYQQYINSILWGDFENLNEFYYPSGKYRNSTIPSSNSILLSLGYRDEKFLGNFFYSIEGYYKSLNNLLIFAPNEVSDELPEMGEFMLADFFKTGEGYSLGAELSVRKDLGKVFGGLSYSYGFSVMKEENDTFSYYPDWHRPYSIKADLGLNWFGKDGLWRLKKKGKYFRSSTQLKIVSGAPITGFSGYTRSHLVDQGVGRDAGGPNPIYYDNISVPPSQRNMGVLPYYQRWDIKAVDWGREGKWAFTFTILNVLNRENVFFKFTNTEENPPEIITITQFPFFPFLINYKYHFDETFFKIFKPLFK